MNWYNILLAVAIYLIIIGCLCTSINVVPYAGSSNYSSISEGMNGYRGHGGDQIMREVREKVMREMREKEMRKVREMREMRVKEMREKEMREKEMRKMREMREMREGFESLQSSNNFANSLGKSVGESECKKVHGFKELQCSPNQQFSTIDSYGFTPGKPGCNGAGYFNSKGDLCLDEKQLTALHNRGGNK